LVEHIEDANVSSFAGDQGAGIERNSGDHHSGARPSCSRAQPRRSASG
jgi:hypothetical protein